MKYCRVFTCNFADGIREDKIIIRNFFWKQVSHVLARRFIYVLQVFLLRKILIVWLLLCMHAFKWALVLTLYQTSKIKHVKHCCFHLDLNFWHWYAPGGAKIYQAFKFSMEKWRHDFGKLFAIIVSFHFLASFLELTICALKISLKNHGNQDKRKKTDL